MISRSLGLNCSQRCELLLSYAYLKDKSNIIAYAHCLVNDDRQAAIRLAKHLKEIPENEAQKLIAKTFKNSNFKIPENPQNILEKIKSIIKGFNEK